MKIANEVAEVLRSLEWRGRVGIVTVPFDAKLFEKVYAVMEDLGGTWSPRHGGHMFETEDDRRNAVKAINAGMYHQPSFA